MQKRKSRRNNFTDINTSMENSTMQTHGEGTILCRMLDKYRSLRHRLCRGSYLLDYGSLVT
jgi:hypothetical protein